VHVGKLRIDIELTAAKRCDNTNLKKYNSLLTKSAQSPSIEDALTLSLGTAQSLLARTMQ